MLGCTFKSVYFAVTSMDSWGSGFGSHPFSLYQMKWAPGRPHGELGPVFLGPVKDAESSTGPVPRNNNCERAWLNLPF